MTIATYRITYHEDDLDLEYLLKIDRDQLADEDLRDVLGSTGSIQGEIDGAGGDLELAVANASRAAAIVEAYANAAALNPGKAAANALKRYDSWCADGLEFEFTEIELTIDSDGATVTKVTTEEPSQ
mgnify:CR=1 FL=1|tara:strand:+ start:3096 stop:3476 length:381 start_codon:yes stop_codon:yes gene_type:complete